MAGEGKVLAKRGICGILRENHSLRRRGFPAVKGGLRPVLTRRACPTGKMADCCSLSIVLRK